MRKPTIVLGLVLLLAGSAAWAADTGRYWKAALPTPTGQSVDLFVTLVQQDETWTGKLDMPQSGIRGLALTDVSVEGMNIKFTIAGLPGNPVFEGTLAADGDAIEGNLAAGGQALPLSFSPTEPPAEPGGEPLAAFMGPGVPGEGPGGDWRGVLEVGPAKLRLVLHVTGEGDALKATLDSIEQGATGLEFDDVMVEDGSYYFGMTRLGASFDAELSEDGSELRGTWSQGGQQVPLVFRRVKAAG